MEYPNNRDKRVQKSPKVRFLLVLGIAIFMLYLALGLAVIFWKKFPINLTMPYRVAFGVLLVVYAFFRFIRLIQKKES